MSTSNPSSESPSRNASIRAPPPPPPPPAFPAFYRRRKEEAPPSSTDLEDGASRSMFSGRGAASVQAPSAVREKTLAAVDVGELERVVYAPMPEHKRLGYLSVASLIINKMIGTGIFSQPANVLKGTGGSKGAALFLWVVGGIMTLAGLLIYLEFGILLPYNGGEFIYLQEAYTRPRYLAGCVFATLFILVGNTAPNCFIFAQYIVQSAAPEIEKPDTRLLKFIAVVCISFICLIHVFSRKLGIITNNALALYKVVLLTFVCVSGFAALGGAGASHGDEDYGTKNFSHSFREISKTTPYSYASAFLAVLFAYRGWENANYVLSEVKRPRGDESRTYRRGVLFAFALVSTLYLLANIAYFAASSVEEIEEAGVILAAKFFGRVFGTGAFVKRGLPIFIALSAFGNLIATTYTRCRVDQEFAKQRILPFSKYWARNSPYGTPVGGLTLHWLFTVILILATPNKANGEAYTLVSNLFVYGQAWVSLFAAIGIVILKYHHKFREWTPAVIKNFPILYALAAFYVLLNLFIIVLLWWPPDKQGVISSYVTPGVSTALLAAGVVYWAIFAKVLPYLGYEIDDEPEELADGTIVVTYKRHLTGWAKRVHSKWKSGWGGRFSGGGHDGLDSD